MWLNLATYLLEAFEADLDLLSDRSDKRELPLVGVSSSEESLSVDSSAEVQIVLSKAKIKAILKKIELRRQARCNIYAHNYDIKTTVML